MDDTCDNIGELYYSLLADDEVDKPRTQARTSPGGAPATKDETVSRSDMFSRDRMRRGNV